MCFDFNTCLQESLFLFSLKRHYESIVPKETYICNLLRDDGGYRHNNPFLS